MNPDKIIAAFLKVWETQPDDIFTTSGAVDGLETLKTWVEKSEAESNQVFVQEYLAPWLKEYPQLREVVFAQARKFDPDKPISQPQAGKTTGNKTLPNHYPQIPDSLRKRIGKS